MRQTATAAERPAWRRILDTEELRCALFSLSSAAMIVKIFLAVALLVGVSFIYQSVRDTRREIDTLEGWTRHSASVAPVSVRWTAS